MTVSETVETGQTSPPRVPYATVDWVSFSVEMGTAPAHTFCVTPTRTVPTAPMRTRCCVVRTHLYHSHVYTKDVLH